jgi:hypothetical protein
MLRNHTAAIPKNLCAMSVETNVCVAKELCICLTAVADARHVCPAWQSTCEDASLLYHTTCFPCCAQYKRTFDSPDDFQLHVGSIAAAQVMDGDNVSPKDKDIFEASDKASASFCPAL